MDNCARGASATGPRSTRMLWIVTGERAKERRGSAWIGMRANERRTECERSSAEGCSSRARPRIRRRESHELSRADRAGCRWPRHVRQAHAAAARIRLAEAALVLAERGPELESDRARGRAC